MGKRETPAKCRGCRYCEERLSMSIKRSVETSNRQPVFDQRLIAVSQSDVASRTAEQKPQRFDPSRCCISKMRSPSLICG